MKPITVLLAEDHTIVREGFRKMLELEAGIKVVGEAADGRQAVALARKLEPAVVLMDIAMPRLNGLEATRQLLKAWPAVRVLILSAHSDAAYVQNAVAAGAAGFLLKQDSAHEVCRAIRTVQKGKTFFSPAVARQLARLLPRASGSGAKKNRLRSPPGRSRSCSSSRKAGGSRRLRPTWASAPRPPRNIAAMSWTNSISTIPLDWPVTPSAPASSRTASL